MNFKWTFFAFSFDELAHKWTNVELIEITSVFNTSKAHTSFHDASVECKPIDDWKPFRWSQKMPPRHIKVTELLWFMPETGFNRVRVMQRTMDGLVNKKKNRARFDWKLIWLGWFMLTHQSSFLCSYNCYLIRLDDKYVRAITCNEMRREMELSKLHEIESSEHNEKKAWEKDFRNILSSTNYRQRQLSPAIIRMGESSCEVKPQNQNRHAIKKFLLKLTSSSLWGRTRNLTRNIIRRTALMILFDWIINLVTPSHNMELLWFGFDAVEWDTHEKVQAIRDPTEQLKFLISCWQLGCRGKKVSMEKLTRNRHEANEI